jgi:hypothetical protein
VQRAALDVDPSEDALVVARSLGEPARGVADYL